MGCVEIHVVWFENDTRLLALGSTALFAMLRHRKELLEHLQRAWRVELDHLLNKGTYVIFLKIEANPHKSK